MKCFSVVIAGKTILFGADTPDMLESCLRAQFGGVQEYTEESYGSFSGSRMSIYFAGGGPGSTDGEYEKKILGNDGDDSYLWYCRETGNAEAVINVPGRQDRERLCLSVITTFPQLLMLEMGKFVFHASAVSLNGKGILIGGPNGSGKSTIMRRLLEAGAEYVADDAAAVRQDSGRYYVERTPELMNVADLDPAARDMLYGRGFRIVGDGPFMEPPADPFEAAVSIILFPSVVKGDLSTVSLTNKEAFLKLLELRRTPLEADDFQKFVDFCTGMAEGVPVCRLNIPPGKIPAPGEIAGICESL